MIKMIKFYQGVLLGRDTLMSFTPDEGHSDAVNRKNLKAEEVDRGVLVSNEQGKVLVPWNNVAYIQYVLEPKTESKKSK